MDKHEIASTTAPVDRLVSCSEWFNGVPQRAGVYWFAENAADWDLKQIIGVRRLESPRKSWTEADIDGEWVDTRSQRFRKSLWYGPFPNPPQPSDVLLASIGS